MNDRAARLARRYVLVSCAMLGATASAYATSRTQTHRPAPARPHVRAVAYHGRTSQRRPISLTLSGGSVTKLRYRIDDVCPNGKHLFVTAWGFPPLPIKHSRFGGRFVAKAPHEATATINGRVSATAITGSLSDRSRNSRTRRICHGQATFRLQRH